MQRQLISQVLKVRYRSTPLVGQSALALMALADGCGLADSRVAELVDIYYAALDVGVTGEVLQTLPARLNPRVWPEWMRGRSRRPGLTYRPSPPSSVLGRLHGALGRLLAEAGAAERPHVAFDPMLHLEGSERCAPTHAARRPSPRSLPGACLPAARLCLYASNRARVPMAARARAGSTQSGGGCTRSTAVKWRD